MKSFTPILAALFAASSLRTCNAFAPSTSVSVRKTTNLAMADDDEDFMRWARQSRSASTGDNMVELKRPLGLILKEDEDTGNVYVETVAPRGNAARTGQVKEGDIITMCSATFGDQMWSCRGVGLTRVLAAIRVRAGPTVSLVLESPNQTKATRGEIAKQAAAAREAKERAQKKKDLLLSELENDEKKLKKGKFLGLF